MIALDQLVGLALGELDGADLDAVEEHVLACGACATTLERLMAIGGGVRELVAAGRVAFVASGPLLARLEREGLISRTYRIAPGGMVPCTVGPDDVYAAALLTAPVEGVTRIDLIRPSILGDERVEDVPFDAERGLVSLVTRSDRIRTYPTMRLVFELVAVGVHGDRSIGRYTLEHTAPT